MMDSGSASISGLELGPCARAEWEEALEVLYQRMEPSSRRQAKADVLAQAELGELDLSGLWMGRHRGRVVGAMLTQALAGRAVALWAPEVQDVRSMDRTAVAVELVRSAIGHYRRRGYRLVQCLLGSDAPAEASTNLELGGMHRVTDLYYYERSTEEPLVVEPGAPCLHWRGFGPDVQAEFGLVMARTYRESLDMPELEGLRSLEDILAGHSAVGRFEPTRWRLGRVAGESAAAIVLLSGPSPAELYPAVAWELSYLGLTPEARGRGLGDAALAHALELARPHAPRLELAVDSRNFFAERLYRRAGFVLFDRRAVHLATFPVQADSATRS